MSLAPRAGIWIAGTLAIVAIALFAAGRLTGYADSPETRKAPARPVSGERLIVRQVEAIAAAFTVPRSAMRILAAKETKSGVPELRMRVGPEFSSYEFQSALVGALADFDVAIIGTERTHEKSIVMRITKDSATVLLVDLDLRKSLQQQRKESSH